LFGTSKRMIHDASPARLCELETERHIPHAEVVEPNAGRIDLCQTCGCPNRRAPLLCGFQGLL
jgi:hypothetical protein